MRKKATKKGGKFSFWDIVIGVLLYLPGFILLPITLPLMFVAHFIVRHITDWWRGHKHKK